MEKKHKKSKRSLKGDDVYEMACRYDVGWSKKRRKNADGTDGRNQVSIVDRLSCILVYHNIIMLPRGLVVK